MLEGKLEVAKEAVGSSKSNWDIQSNGQIKKKTMISRTLHRTLKTDEH
jgi:hypothetical protein